MSQYMQELPKYLNTAGKITVLTSFLGVVAFAVVFLLNIGANELKHVEAQSGQATTTITVLNTPPLWNVPAEEEYGSSTTTPTNSGDEVAWVATGTDSNSAPYFLLICDGPNAALPAAAAGPAFLGTAPPSCTATSTQWAVSASTTSGEQARAATTTLEAWAESNDWYAYICDDDPVNPRCNATSYQGTGTTSSPFNVNHRPSFTVYSDDSPADPGAVVTFSSTASDADVTGAADTVRLFVCSTNSFSVASTTCDATTLASTTAGQASDPTATYTIPIPTQDTNYFAYGFVVDNHGHVSSGGQTGVDSVLTVSNVAPYVLGGDIDLNNGSAIILTEFAGETTGFPLQFTVNDNNSCENTSSGDEIVDWEISVFRSGVGTTTCDEVSEYDPNSCYTSTVATTTWNISCTASSTSCTYDGVTDFDTSMVVDCTFPLWYIADPTDGDPTLIFYESDNWSAAVSPIDDNSATGTFASTTNPRELNALLGIALDTAFIPYGALEPGDATGPTLANSSTTIRAIGNVAVDELLSGESMCGTYTSAVSCPNSATSTIPEYEQVFSATSTDTYLVASTSGNRLSSTTPVELELNVKKSTTTSEQSSGVTYWGISVPISITLAGNYTGENTFTGKVAETGDWY